MDAARCACDVSGGRCAMTLVILEQNSLASVAYNGSAAPFHTAKASKIAAYFSPDRTGSQFSTSPACINPVIPIYFGKTNTLLCTNLARHEPDSVIVVVVLSIIFSVIIISACSNRLQNHSMSYCAGQQSRQPVVCNQQTAAISCWLGREDCTITSVAAVWGA